ncbi:hypothetical protein [Clostridium beijerinckii]|jgi:hypothetical protein|uniref:Uncharacterized protein n=2 Tax=Clostridium beijerinckii TaxID=1520 RepID=A0A1W7LW26_CLOBE|nr:hypothetical protein [Clostridium beijerinckii]ABR34902.1 hypothetical protein Cbei_2751 [Clostridium beijerinckii NCIMB 8052]AIU05022.1 hypothetical protein Cbs_2751 [Clostridium beijerinckii ATCC 35702]MBE6090783.1 hypothetical protein [Clostridium beijerinckii]MBF7810463.1 hypothetical protein [Clostridium beijerinckii]NOW04397.1 hypothetical protein [Clostridium beijerinckii]
MYIKFKWEWFENGKEYDTYMEIVNGYAERQIMICDNRYIASNREDNDMGFFLAEGLIETNELDEVVSQNEFEEVWSIHSKCILEDWLRAKEYFTKGKEVEGILKVFYPQGVIIELENKTIAIADYEECARNSEAKNLYPNHLVSAKVKDYDEKNMWIILEDAKVQL